MFQKLLKLVARTSVTRAWACVMVVVVAAGGGGSGSDGPNYAAKYVAESAALLTKAKLPVKVGRKRG